MKLRHLKWGDIPQIIHLGGRMHYESCYGDLNYHPETVIDYCQQILSGDADLVGLVVESEGAIIGMLAAEITPYLFGSGKVAQDTIVYVPPEHRGGKAFLMLAGGYKKWASIRADKTFLTQTTGIDPEKTAKLYQKMGFEYMGSNFKTRG